MNASTSVQTISATSADRDDGGIRAPAPPRTIEDTGLPLQFLVDLTLKTFFQGGRLPLWDLSGRLRLPLGVVEGALDFMRAERLVEVPGRGPAETDLNFQLTDTGRSRAEVALKRSQYVGPAPVTLDAYVTQIERQSVAHMTVTQDRLAAVFDGVVIAPALLDQIGSALNSGRAVLVYGPAGSGKTFIAEHVVNVLYGDIHVPHAIMLDGEVIQVYDPLVHKPSRSAARNEGLDRRQTIDERWLRCRRPAVMTGGELTLQMLDLQFDHETRFYTAPPQVKANNGIFIIDDLGRQLVAPQELMNRWIVPLDRRVDYLALHTGKKFRVPFDVNVIFSSNYQPADLADEAFLRRLGYKIHVGPVSPDAYRSIFIGASERAGVPFDEDAFQALLRDGHARDQRPLLACIPFDIVSKVRDRAAYLGTTPRMTPESLVWAWQCYFATD